VNTAAALLELHHTATWLWDAFVKMLDTCSPGYAGEPNTLDLTLHPKKPGLIGE